MKKVWIKIKHWYALANTWFDTHPTWDIDNPARIIPAFKHGGKQYYQFEDINNMMTGRAFTAVDFYHELSMRITREYLEKHCEAMDKILDGTEIKVMDIAQLHIQMKERLTMILDSEVVYKIASVVYFTKDESPWSYDYKYNQKKIETGKKCELKDFFFMIRVNDLITGINLSDQDFETFMKVGNTVNKAHLENISTLK